MTEEIKTDELVKTIQTLTKENDELKVKVEEIDKVKEQEKKETEITKRVQEELDKKKTVKKGEEEDEDEEEKKKKEPKKTDEKEKPKSKGVVSEKKDVDLKESHDIFEVTESGDLTMTHEAWKEFDNSIRDTSYMNQVKWFNT